MDSPDVPNENKKWCIKCKGHHESHLVHEDDVINQKCKKCDFASVQAHNLRRELKKAYKYNQLQLSIYSGRRFERTSENSLR